MADQSTPELPGLVPPGAEKLDPTANKLVPPTSDTPEASGPDTRPLSVDLKDLRQKLVKGFEAESSFDKSQPKNFTEKQGISLPQPDDSALEEPNTEEDVPES